MDVEEETFPRKKKIHVNAASVRSSLIVPTSLLSLQLVELKAALYSKQKEARQDASRQLQNKKVSDKVLKEYSLSLSVSCVCLDSCNMASRTKEKSKRSTAT